ncbi:MAG TPA: SRPBCC family protein [Candidatus Angelobacter sp.]|jgi:ribosome-associated toxin RatA of RatAB toxin-antitoxin module|nr:SRPBCC family protein [Candidatus Angelobacter sp.]
MPLVEVNAVMPASVERVWGVMNDVEAYPRIMNHVRSVKVLEHGSNYRRTAWEMELKGCALRWTEREEIDAEHHRIEYQSIEGDMAQFEGFWRLDPLSDGTCRATLSVLFDIGIPLMSDMLNPVAERAIRESSLLMLTSIGAYAASSAEPPGRVTTYPTGRTDGGA